MREHCEKKLAEAKARIETIVTGPGGAVTAKPTDKD